MIPVKDYRKAVELLPIFCVDIVIVNRDGDFLLVKRANHPLRRRYWVVGGRVHKGETGLQAAARKARQEVGLKLSRFELVGFYEGVFRQNPFNVPSGVHTVSVVYRARVRGDEKIRLDAQSTAWKYSKTLPAGFRCQVFAAKAPRAKGRGEGMAA